MRYVSSQLIVRFPPLVAARQERARGRAIPDEGRGFPVLRSVIGPLQGSELNASERLDTHHRWPRVASDLCPLQVTDR